MQIHLSDGAEVFPYQKVAEVKFESNGIRVTSDNREFPYLYSEITKIDFGNGNISAIPVVEQSMQSEGLLLTGNILSSTAGVPIAVYNLMGIKVADYLQSGDISPLPGGVYIAVSNDKKLKFVKK